MTGRFNVQLLVSYPHWEQTREGAVDIHMPSAFTGQRNEAISSFQKDEGWSTVLERALGSSDFQGFKRNMKDLILPSLCLSKLLPSLKPFKGWLLDTFNSTISVCTPLQEEFFKTAGLSSPLPLNNEQMTVSKAGHLGQAAPAVSGERRRPRCRRPPNAGYWVEWETWRN